MMDLQHFNQTLPQPLQAIMNRTREVGFTMSSDTLTGSLLRTLAASKPAGNMLELGTGTGLSTCWMLDGMDQSATLLSIDNDQETLRIAKEFLGKDSRLTLTEADGATWLKNNTTRKFDLVFADTWPGKYFQLEEVLAMVQPGGLYIVDDMTAQPNWPPDHPAKAKAFIRQLENRKDLAVTKLHWATGIIIATKLG